MEVFRASAKNLSQQAHYRENEKTKAFLFATNHPYHYVANIKPDPEVHFLVGTFNMGVYPFERLLEEHPPIAQLAESIKKHFAIPEDIFEPLL